MAVATGYVGSAAIAWSASATGTVTSQSIGTASWDRIVVVGVSIEADFAINSCTIGGVTATAGPILRNTTATPDISCAFFYLPVSSGTTANVVVTLSGSTTTTGRISVWAMTGASVPHVDSNTNSGTGTTITLTGVTVPTNGAGFWCWANATAAATTWTNATERDDTGVGAAAYQHGAADTTTAGTLTITADGANAQQTIIGMSFNERPPGGWDQLPQFEKSPVPPNTVSVALAACAGLIMPSYPYVQEAVPDFTHAETTSNYTFTRNLYYQSKVQVLSAPPEPPVLLTMDWQPPLSTVPHRRPVVKPVVPFVPDAAVLQNTVTPEKWLRPFRKAVPGPKLNVSNLIHAPRPIDGNYGTFSVHSTYLTVKVLQYQDKFEAIAVAAPVVETTPDQWMPSWQQATPRGQPPATAAVPFVPREATSENTVDISNWQQPFVRAVPALNPPTPTQPFYGFPYEAADNTRPEWDWNIQWKAPPRNLLELPGGLPFVPAEATRENTVTPDKWLQSWKAPPSYRPIKVQTPPFVPREATSENTVTPDTWLFRFEKAVPKPPVWRTQPFYGFPYEGVDNTRNEWDWSIAWQGPPRYLQRLQPGSPFVPKEAVLENTATVEKWLFRFEKAVPAPDARPTQPFYGYPYESVVTVTPTEHWYPPLSRAVPRPPVNNRLHAPFVPREATRENTITGIAWQQSWQGPPRRARAPYQQTVRADEFIAPDNNITGSAWLPPLSQAVPATKLRVEKWHYQAPQEIAAAPAAAPYALFSAQSSFLATRKLFYQDRFEPVSPPPAVAPQDFATFSVATNFVAVRSFFYQDLFAPLNLFTATAPPDFATFSIKSDFVATTHLHYQEFFPVIGEPPPFVEPPVEVPPKVWTPDGTVSGTWTQDAPGICGVEAVVVASDAFQDDTFQADTFQVSGEVTATETECWTADVAVVNTWTQDEPDP